MPIQKKNFSAAHLHNGLAKFDDQLDVGHLADTERSRKEKVVSGMARPESREAKDFGGPLAFETAGDGCYYIGIGRKRQVRTMLFERAKREQNEVLREINLPHFRPG